MNNSTTRKSWDTSVKHLARFNLLKNILSKEQYSSIPKSNISRWKNEAENKYEYNELNDILKQEIELIKRINQSSKVKCINKSYFKLVDTFHEIIIKVKGVKTSLRKYNDLIINTIESVKEFVPINTALKVFNLSRSTFEHYKNRLIYKCDASYFNWCVKRHPNQLLESEIQVIKSYMTHRNYKFWSKSSVYLKAVRDEKLSCGLATFYKYCSLLGFSNIRPIRKTEFYNPFVSGYPNQLWCADVTIFKTLNGNKYHLHFLMDHYSKKILGYKIESTSSAIAIRNLISQAYHNFEPNNLKFLSDGGCENVNTTVRNFLTSVEDPIKHLIAQKTVSFSNSMIEAFNKTLKYQFLYPNHPNSYKQLKIFLEESVEIYNNQKPQMNLGGNTPNETFNGKTIELNNYTKNFHTQKAIRIELNKKSMCTKCS